MQVLATESAVGQLAASRAAAVATPFDTWSTFARHLVEQPWGDFRDFWLAQVFDDRLLVVWFLPLVPVLLLTPRRALKPVLLTTSWLFIGYVFGLACLAIWCLLGLGLYRLSEFFARESQRTDVLKIGPPLFAGGLIVGVYVATLALRFVPLPVELNEALRAHAPYLLPLGARGLWFEPSFRVFELMEAKLGTIQVLTAALLDPHTWGAAYLLCRMLHYFSELKRATIPAERRSLLNFLTYISYGPAIIQGPIERYPVFLDEIESCAQRRSWRNAAAAAARVAMGVLKAVIGAVVLRPLMYYKLGLVGHPDPSFHYFNHPESIETVWLYLGMFIPILWIYVEFSAYCDINAAIARLLGYRQIENFNRPWLATSLRDFWRRWHISLSFILRDYIYIPLGGNRRHGTLNLCITFFLCGVWHPSAATAGAWGLLMGLLIAANQRWVDWVKRVDAGEPAARSALARGLAAARRMPAAPEIVAWLVTQHVFVWSLLLFAGGAAVATVPLELLRRAAATLRAM